VAKLGLVCSPSVITGDPVASNFSMVSRTASLQIDSNSSRDKLPRSYCSKAVTTSGGRGILPIGSVGMVISKSRKDSDARQALTRESNDALQNIRDQIVPNGIMFWWFILT